MLSVKVIENAAHYRPRPKSIPGYHRFSNGRFDAFVHEQNVLQTIAHWAQPWGDSEIAGRLVGRVYRDDCEFWCVITGAILADFRGGPTTVKTTNEDAAHTARALEERHPAEDLLGWYHSHPFGLDEYSSVDRANQAEWGKPYHLGLLVSRHLGFAKIHAFRGPDSERLLDSYIVPVGQLSSRSPTPQSIEARPSVAAPQTVCVHRHSALSEYRDLVAFTLFALATVACSFLLTDALADQLRPVVDRVHETQLVTEQLRSEFQQHTQQVQNHIREIENGNKERLSASAARIPSWITDLYTPREPGGPPGEAAQTTATDDTSHDAPVAIDNTDSRP